MRTLKCYKFKQIKKEDSFKYFTKVKFQSIFFLVIYKDIVNIQEKSNNPIKR